jgi:sodium/potassium-transporting ATPase subunit alpha
MRIQNLPAQRALSSLRSGQSGLTSAEISRRLDRFGLNLLEPTPRQPIAERFLRSFTHFFAVLLWLAAGLALIADLYQPDSGMGVLAAAIVAVILINGLFSFWQDYKAERELASLAKLLPQRVKVVRDGGLATCDATQLVPGDVIQLAEGDRVPADARVIDAQALRINAAALTGEAEAVFRDAQPTEEADELQARNLVLTGASVVAGEGRAVVYATGAHTQFGRIAKLTQGDNRERSPLLAEIARVSRIIGVMATVAGVVLAAIGMKAGLPLWSAFVFGIGIIVANVPEGLLPTVTLALAMGARRMAKRNVLIRHLPAVETLGSSTVICTDKTGTLTLNRMTVKATFGPSEAIAAVERHCHTLKRSDDGWLGDPMEVALVEHAGPGPVYPLTGEVPFDTDRKRLSTLHATPEGRAIYTKGAVETVLPLCSRYADGAELLPLDQCRRDAVLRAQEDMANRGLRVLALAWRTEPDAADPERDLILAGFVGLQDPPRPEVPDAIAKARAAGIRVIMITGDHPHTALAIAREIGLVQGPEPEVVTGDRLRVMSEAHLTLALDAEEILFARIGADQKLRVVQALQRRGEIVAVTGDGVNDAPALKQGDIGIAMGRGGTDVAREAADMVLLDDNFASIVNAVEEGRAVFANIRKFMTYILASNVPELVPYLAFGLLGVPLPLTVIQILAVDLGTDMLPALALGVEPPHRTAMIEPPRSRRQPLLTAGLILRAYMLLGLFEAVAALSAYFAVLYDGGWQWGQGLASGDLLYRQATTACLVAIVLGQVANVFLCRGERDSILDRAVPRNWYLWWAVAAEIGLILLIVYTSPGNSLFGTAPLPAWAWAAGLPAIAAMVVADELRKWVQRSRGK